MPLPAPTCCCAPPFLLSPEQALPYREHLLGVGLDSAEQGYPPSLFTDVFAEASKHGLRLMAHAGERGGGQPPAGHRGACGGGDGVRMWAMRGWTLGLVYTARWLM